MAGLICEPVPDEARERRAPEERVRARVARLAAGLSGSEGNVRFAAALALALRRGAGPVVIPVLLEALPDERWVLAHGELPSP